MVDVAAHSHWWLPVRYVMRNRYDSVSCIRQYTGPVFQYHGTADTLIPIAFGRRLFEASPSIKKQFVEGAGLRVSGTTTASRTGTTANWQNSWMKSTAAASLPPQMAMRIKGPELLDPVDSPGSRSVHNRQNSATRASIRASFTGSR
jgi:hypothetical protein